MVNYELYHAGIKGMKWGVRRYQNKDGSLTPAGKKRYDRDTKDMNDKKKQKYQADTDKWVKDDLNAGRRLADESAGLTNKLKSANDTAMRNKPRAKMDLSNMTDQQMRNEINRALLERQYNDMFAPKKVSRGREVAGKILEVAGTTLGVASSALGIALAIKELRG
jgi:hypothetical protein